MSEWNLTDATEQWITCPYCDAQPGKRCRTSGGRYTTPHNDRRYPLTVAFSVGWSEGFGDGQRRAQARQAAQS